MLIASCGGSSVPESGEGDAAEAAEATGDGADGGSGGPCDSFGFTGTATRSADDGFGQVAGDYSTRDFTDARSRVKDGLRAALFVASFELPESFLSLPDVPEGGVAMKFDVTDLDTLAPGDSYEFNSGGRLPLISNGGSGGNAGASEDIGGTVTLLEFSDDTVCVDVDYEDTFHRIVGVFSVPNEAL